MINSTQYSADNGKYLRPLNFAGTLGKVDNTALQLINSCKHVYKDAQGEYVYDATSFDAAGNVYFTRRNLLTT